MTNIDSTSGNLNWYPSGNPFGRGVSGYGKNVYLGTGSKRSRFWRELGDFSIWQACLGMGPIETRKDFLCSSRNTEPRESTLFPRQALRSPPNEPRRTEGQVRSATDSTDGRCKKGNLCTGAKKICRSQSSWRLNRL